MPKPLFLAAFLAMGFHLAVAQEAEETVCGPGIVTIGDAWEYLTAEQAEISQLLKAGDLDRWPQRLAAVNSHVRFIEKKAYFLFGAERRALSRCAAAIGDARPRSNAAAFAGDREGLKKEWNEIEQSLTVMAKQLPAEALLPTSQIVHILPQATCSTKLKLAEPVVLVVGQPARVVFVAQESLAGPALPVRPEDLVELHGARMHALIADVRLADYQHVHPEPTQVPGEYAFTFTPKSQGPYRCWVNLAPTKTGREEFPFMDLSKAESYPVVPKDAQITSLTADLADLLVSLHFSQPRVEAGALIPAYLSIIQTSTGQPVTDLEPYLGSFAHIVTFSEDYQTVTHIHPHGFVPKPGEKGGPLIEFTLRPALPGYVKMFVQVQRNGSVITLPFGFQVEKLP